MKNRPSISGLMRFVLSFALLLGFARSPSLWPYAIYLWFTGLALLIVADWFWFSFFPTNLLDFVTRGNVAARGRLLKLVAATPRMFGDRSKILPRTILFYHHLKNGKLDEAESVACTLLRHEIPPGIEAPIRRELADALETAGRLVEAGEHRRLAAACLDKRGNKLDPSEWLARGIFLGREGRHAEACNAHERGLGALAVSGMTGLRVELLTHLALAEFNGGRPAEAARRAEETIAAGAEGYQRFLIHRTAGLALGELGRLDDAEAHRRRALELAEASGDPTQVANGLAQLADVERKRGKLAEAEQSCLKAEALGGVGFEHYGTWFATLRSQGRFEEARGRLRQALDASPLPIPAHDRKRRGTLGLGMSRVEIDLGRWPEAEAHIREARAALEADPKLRLSVEALEAWIAAGLGRRDEAASGIDRVEARLSEFPDDRTARVGALAAIGRAALLLRDNGRALDLFVRMEEAEPDPVDRPFGHYYRGEALLGLGRVEDAREAFRRAVAKGIDSHHARLARQKLESGDVEPSRPLT